MRIVYIITGETIPSLLELSTTPAQPPSLTHSTPTLCPPTIFAQNVEVLLEIDVIFYIVGHFSVILCVPTSLSSR